MTLNCCNCGSFFGMDSSYKSLCITCRTHFLKNGVQHTYRRPSAFINAIFDDLIIRVVHKNKVKVSSYMFPVMPVKFPQ